MVGMSWVVPMERVVAGWVELEGHFQYFLFILANVFSEMYFEALEFKSLVAGNVNMARLMLA